jgi:hypothetical protein
MARGAHALTAPGWHRPAPETHPMKAGGESAVVRACLRRLAPRGVPAWTAGTPAALMNG